MAVKSSPASIHRSFLPVTYEKNEIFARSVIYFLCFMYQMDQTFREFFYFMSDQNQEGMSLEN